MTENFLDFDDHADMRKVHYKEIIDKPIEWKINHSKNTIREFFNWAIENEHPEITLSFSGGKDSSVLLNLVEDIYKKEFAKKIDLILMYATEVTFPETYKFIKKVAKEKGIPLEIKPPKLQWNEGLQLRGFPIYSKQFSVRLNRIENSRTKNDIVLMAFGLKSTMLFKVPFNRLYLLDKKMHPNHSYSEKCCDFIKGGIKKDKRPAFIGTMSVESTLRKRSWIDDGCNITNDKKPMSRPLSIWTEENIWEYIEKNNVQINSSYFSKTGEKIFNRLGCTACPYGAHLDKQKNIYKGKFHNRFEILKEHHEQLYESQVYGSKIYLALLDMDLEITNDERYMDLLRGRRQEVSQWYENIEFNLVSMLIGITQGKAWKWEKEEIVRVYKYFNIDFKESNYKKAIKGDARYE